METDQYINDRYAAIEERLAVCTYLIFLGVQAKTLFSERSGVVATQVVRKRLNRPLTLAEKVCCPRRSSVFAPALRECCTWRLGEAWGAPVACELLQPMRCQPFWQAAPAAAFAALMAADALSVSD